MQMGRSLTAEQLDELETFCRAHANTSLVERLLSEFRAQQKAITALRLYLDMFAEADGTVSDVADLISDLREILDGV